MALGKRRQEIKRLVRQAKAAKAGSSGTAPAAKPPKEVILGGAPPAAPAKTSDTEANLKALPAGGIDPNEETEVAFGTEPALPVVPAPEPESPPSVVFACPCGTKLTATKQTYDRRIRCPKCRAELLLNLIRDPRNGHWQIEPFRTEV
jgi:DNA-directed RNA polymerase subunit RPC12/RpoP